MKEPVLKMYLSASSRFLVAILAVFALTGCVRTVTTAAGAAASIGATAVKTSVNATGDIVEAAVPGGDEEATHHDDNPRPFDESRNAMMDVDAALAAASISGRNILLVLGANWCHDSRGLAANFERPELAAVIEDNYELVWVDVGRRDRNLDIAARFGVFEVLGTPTVLIVSPDGNLLNVDSVHDWRNAASISYDETLAYFQDFTPKKI